jgi:hypothetical protein
MGSTKFSYKYALALRIRAKIQGKIFLKSARLRKTVPLKNYLLKSLKDLKRSLKDNPGIFPLRPLSPLIKKIFIESVLNLTLDSSHRYV